MADGHLKQIAPLSNAHAGGEYDPTHQTMRLPLGALTSNATGHFDRNEVVFTLGHELQHGFNRADTQAAKTVFRQEIIAKAQSSGPVHDYTEPVGKMLARNRRDEAGSELAGWNALVGMVRHENPNAGLKNIYEANPGRAQDFIKPNYKTQPVSYALRSGLVANTDLSLSDRPENLEAMGQHYFDKSAAKSRLGHHGSAD